MALALSAPSRHAVALIPASLTRALGRPHWARPLVVMASSTERPPGQEAPAAAAPGAATPRTRLSQGQLVEAVLRRSARPLVDIGANLCDKSFDKDREEVIARAAAAGVSTLLVTGSCERSSAAAERLSALERPAGGAALRFTAGVHPHNAKQCGDGTLAALRALAASPHCAAVGECGLDFNRNFSPPAVQEEWFAAQVGLAEELGLPLFMHCRDAWPRFGELLR